MVMLNTYKYTALPYFHFSKNSLNQVTTLCTPDTFSSLHPPPAIRIPNELKYRTDVSYTDQVTSLSDLVTLCRGREQSPSIISYSDGINV